MMFRDSAQHEAQVDNNLFTTDFFFLIIELQVPQGAKNMSEIQEYVRFV